MPTPDGVSDARHQFRLGLVTAAVTFVHYRNHLRREIGARARAQGKRLGRPPVPPEVEQAIRNARAEGKGMLKIAHELGVDTATVQRVLRS